MTNDHLLDVQHLSTSFNIDGGVAKAVQDVSFHIDTGETLGLVGESGCGKSVTSLSVMRLIPSPPGTIEHGSINFRGRDLLSLSEADMRRVRGNDIAMIFQEPMTSLNPVFTIGSQYRGGGHIAPAGQPSGSAEPHDRDPAPCGIADPDQRIDEYPHQLSGGMRQRQ